MPKPSREDTYRVTASIGGVEEGVWDKLTGGAADSEESKYRPGAMGPQITLGGSQTIENITISRLFDLDRDAPKIKGWIAGRGRLPVVVTKQPLDIDGNVYGDPIVYTGIEKQVTPPDHDSESNDAALVAIEVSTAGTIG